MKVHKIKDMTGGWFIGNFSPNVFKTKNFEVGYHVHKKGDPTQNHYHKQSTEINVITKGKMIVNNQHLKKGDIFIFEPYEVSEAKFLEDTELIVVRNASLPKDKFII
tara:strand:+ start:1096 stop:1416 length:321 start_codon:yes stop_codon:yes gene_type:complete